MTTALLLLFALSPRELTPPEPPRRDIEEIEILDASETRRQIGRSYENRFHCHSRAETLERVDRLRESGIPTNLRDFLGAEIDHVVVTEIEEELTFERAERLLRTVLSSTVVWPDGQGAGPVLSRDWAESTPVLVSARVCFREPELDTAGVISGCGVLELASSGHLFFQDSRGISWWYRSGPENRTDRP